MMIGPNAFPLSFSRCELTILSQGASVVLSHSISCFFSVFADPAQALCSSHLPTKILQVLYFGTLIILAQPIAFRACVNNHAVNVYAAIAASCAFTYASLWQMMRSEPILWLLNFLFHSEKRVQLMQVWSLCIFTCIAFAALFANFSSATANTVIRKFYHVAIILVFSSGVKHDLNLLHFTSSAALLLLVLLEMIRLTRLPPFGAAIESAFRQFRDEKDSGPLTLTHIYLLIGFALPLWLLPELHSELLIASGLITIGFGDTFASLVGYTLGRHRWPNSKKTYEGTAGAILAQILGGLMFAYYVELPFNTLLIIKLIAISITVALIEASTRQIDNLILPLYFHLFWLLLERVAEL
jgi:dolichol kinase